MPHREILNDFFWRAKSKNYLGTKTKERFQILKSPPLMENNSKFFYGV